MKKYVIIRRVQFCHRKRNILVFKTELHSFGQMETIGYTTDILFAVKEAMILNNLHDCNKIYWM